MAGMRILRPSTQPGLVLLAILVLILLACQPAAMVVKSSRPIAAVIGTPVPESVNPEREDDVFPTVTPTSFQEQTLPTEAETEQIERDQRPARTIASHVNESGESSASPTPTPALVPTHPLPPEAWKSWPVIPQVPENARAIYQMGLALGTNPHAFSILGDCQSLAETFMGAFDTDPAIVADLPPELQAAVVQFSGSFNRLSPTIKGGTTAGAVLWRAWHENLYSCQARETPLDCELRLHNPSIVIINLGTHYEARNIYYLRRILDQLIERGIVPILSTKADNRERDDHLNQEMALLAVEYNLPLWNFYAEASDLPNNGVGIRAGFEHQGEIYLSVEGLERHRYSALQALAAVWQVIQQP